MKCNKDSLDWWMLFCLIGELTPGLLMIGFGVWLLCTI